VHLTASSLFGLVLLAAVALCFFGSDIGLGIIAFKARRLSRALGGRPPDTRAHRVLWRMEAPEFWEYLRRQCARTRDKRLCRLVRWAEVFLVTRMLMVVSLVIIILVRAFVD
jgi:hypothetical protein